MTETRRRASAPLRLDPERRTRPERRRWRELRQAYPGILATASVALAVLLVGNAWLLSRRSAYASEVERLRGEMTAVERERADLILASDDRRLAVMLELMRRQAATDDRLHLNVALDSGRLTLERGGAVLRTIAIELGPERAVGVAPDTVRLTAPRGQRTVERVLGDDERWEVPAWVYAERKLAVPADRLADGALGGRAVLLSGGTLLYAAPESGPLADPAFVLPGSVRVPLADLRAIAPNLTPGMPVYFY